MIPSARSSLALCWLGALAFNPLFGAAAAPASSPMAPFEGSIESLARYACPDWFRDAKFGIWSHWGPQCVPEDGDWYARRLYLSRENKKKKDKGLPDYDPASKPDRGYTLHTERYGHPSHIGYKNIIPLWKAEKWDPERLMGLYVKAGAKYFVSMAVHHDNFDLWDSKYQPRWNAVKTGPKRDVVGEWQKAAKKYHLPFGVSEHLAASFTWFQANKGHDIDGPYKDIPYDGNDPQYADLYHPPTAKDDTGWLTNNPGFHEVWRKRITDLVDKYHPELLYSDSPMPFQQYGTVGLDLVAHYYNANRSFNGGTLTAVYNCKQEPKPTGWVRDIERGVNEDISAEPWQTDTSIGDWYYRKGEQYKSATQIIQMLADIVSKNGNLLINVVQYPNGALSPEVEAILGEMAEWMPANGEALFGTRPFTVYGEGPSVTEKAEAGRFGGAKDVRSRPYSSEDFRFTVGKDGSIYAMFMAWPTGGKVTVKTFGKSAYSVKSVSLLGSAEKLEWKQEADGLSVTLPAKAPCSHVFPLKIQATKL